ncbi:hypothetical protein DOM22_15605 [Bdellovibrio sp. ZAP7]|nr:hypothetical protein DOM22_15605 [Bdellovibrio sp. ZAP7]
MKLKSFAKRMNIESDFYSFNPLYSSFLQSGVDSNDYETLCLKKGEVLYFQRFNRQGFYFIIEGLAKMELSHPTPRVIRLCKRGDMVGYGSWLVPKTENYKLMALQDTTVQFWTKDASESLQRKSTLVNQLLIEHLAQVILHKDERIASLQGETVENRVAHLLLWLAKNFGRQTAQGLLIDISLDRDCMAQLAGTIPVTLARVLTYFEQEKIILREKRKVLVLNIQELEKKTF